MATQLIHLSPHEVENQLDISLREAYRLYKPKLTPPLKLIIFPPADYSNFNQAILYGVLCDVQLAEICVKHLHAAVTDGYQTFVNLLVRVVDELYSKLVETAKSRLIWVASTVVDVAGIGFNSLLVSLLRQIVGGDYSDGNLWLSSQLVSMFLSKWDLIIDEEPAVLTNALYVYLRLLADHCRFTNTAKLVELKRKEIEFCIKTLREQFSLCLNIGRDLIRLLQDLVHIPEFRVFWKDLVVNPSSLNAPGFSDICHLYRIRTSSNYFLLRLTPEMVSQLRFMLTYVKFGSHRRHQVWFANKFLAGPEKESVISDIVRFICCAHHPSSEIIQSEVIPRWAVLGWLMMYCTRDYVKASVKLALFYDWLFFNEKVDDVKNIEPAMLLMVNSISRYADMTNTLLDFLFLLVDNYDVDRKDVLVQGVSSACNILLQRGVIHSLDIFACSKEVSPFLLEKLKVFSVQKQSRIFPSPQHAQPLLHHATTVSSLPHVSSVQNQLPDSRLHSTEPDHVGLHIRPVESSELMSIDSATFSQPSVAHFDDSEVETIQKLVGILGESFRRSKEIGLQTLEKIFLLYVDLECANRTGDVSPKALASQIKSEVESGGYKIFPPLSDPSVSLDSDDTTTVVMRFFVLSQHLKIREMLHSWLRNSLPVGSWLLLYATTLACEVSIAMNLMPKGFLSSYASDSQIQQTCLEVMPMLKSHIDAYLAFMGRINNWSSTQVDSECSMDENLISTLIKGVFNLYRNILGHSGKQFCTDLAVCLDCRKGRMYHVFCIIFSFLPDLSVGEENVVQLLVRRLDHSELVSVQIDITLARYLLFGTDMANMLQLIQRSVHWVPIEQSRLWGLIRSELLVSKFPVEKLLLGFFCSSDLDTDHSSFVVEGFLMLCTSLTPTPELVGAIMLLPGDKFPDFSASVLASWVAMDDSSMLFNSITAFLDKLESKTDGDIPLDLDGININRSGLLYLVNYLESQHRKSVVGQKEEKLLQILGDMKARIWV